jgi:peptidoglycan/LPS O-acetylase OafA/YrhL
MTRGRLDTLTGMRALAAGVVFLDHLPGLLHGRLLSGEEHIGNQGAIGVTFFFALSGFVLTWSAREGDGARAFYRRRFARIYPSYAVACAAGIVLTVVFFKGPLLGGPAASSFLLLQSWVPSKTWYFSYNGVGWSLSDEAFFYLMFPLLIPALRALTRRGRRGVQAGVLLVIGVLAAVSPRLWHGSYFVNHFPPVRLLEFVLGATVAIDGIRGEWVLERLRLSWALVLAGAVYLAADLPVGGFQNVALPIVPVLLLLAAGARSDLARAGAGAPGRRGVLARPLLVWLGDISYCFYLVHQLVLKVLARLLEFVSADPADGLLWAVVGLALSILSAALLHEIVEKPFDRRLRGRRRAAPAVAPRVAPVPVGTGPRAGG